MVKRWIIYVNDSLPPHDAVTSDCVCVFFFWDGVCVFP
jgi:hypothetical protein